jgi:hypothetical protein
MTATLTKPAKRPVAHVDQLAQQLADARNQRKAWEQKEAELVEKLVAAHAAGVAPTKFTSHGWSFCFQEGRKTVVYPEAVTSAVKALQAQAVEAGITETRIGSPFWKIVPAKEEG